MDCEVSKEMVFDRVQWKSKSKKDEKNDWQWWRLGIASMHATMK